MDHPPRARPRRTGRRASAAGGTVVVGITGLPASGKSTVAAMFADLGAETADADRIAHAALEDPAVARRVARILGEAVLGPGGRPDRAAVAARVFGPGGREGLERLEALLHPRVRRGLREAVAGARRRAAPMVVLDVPLLFEGGVDGMCDRTVFVDAPREVRLRRARGRGWTAADLRSRERRQGPAAARRARADFRVPNGGGRAETRRAVGAVWKELVVGGRAAGRA